MFGPFYTLDISLVPVVQIVIAGNEEHSIEIGIQVLQSLKTIVESDNINTGAIIMPISKEHGSFAAFLFGFGSGPFDEIQTIVVVQLTVWFQSNGNVSKNPGFLK